MSRLVYGSRCSAILLQSRLSNWEEEYRNPRPISLARNLGPNILLYSFAFVPSAAILMLMAGSRNKRWWRVSAIFHSAADVVCIFLARNSTNGLEFHPNGSCQRYLNASASISYTGLFAMTFSSGRSTHNQRRFCFRDGLRLDALTERTIAVQVACGPPPESASVGIVHHHKRRTLCRRFVQTISISARSSKGAPARPTRHGGTHDGDSSGFIRPNPLYCFKRTSESTMIKRFSDDRGRTACRRFLRTYYLAFTDRGVMRGRTVIEPVPQEGLAREPS